VRDLGVRDSGESDDDATVTTDDAGAPGLRESDNTCGCTSSQSRARAPLSLFLLFAGALLIRRVQTRL
jgi:MYXO-CTERM domain-containing protein